MVFDGGSPLGVGCLFLSVISFRRCCCILFPQKGSLTGLAGPEQISMLQGIKPNCSFFILMLPLFFCTCQRSQQDTQMEIQDVHLLDEEDDQQEEKDLQQFLRIMSPEQCQELMKLQEEERQLDHEIMAQVRDIQTVFKHLFVGLKANPQRMIQLQIMPIFEDLKSLLRKFGLKVDEFQQTEHEINLRSEFPEIKLAMLYVDVVPVLNLWRQIFDKTLQERRCVYERFHAALRLKKAKDEVNEHFLKGNIRAFCRIRDVQAHNKTLVKIEGHNLQFGSSGNKFSFDKVFSLQSSQQQVSQEFVPYALSGFQGRNSTIFLHGPTATGKTYAAFGDHTNESRKGFIYRCISRMFAMKEDLQKEGICCTIALSCLEIKDDRTIVDLIKVIGCGGQKVGGRKKIVLKTEQKAIKLIYHIQSIRSSSKTNQNSCSSRSFLAIFLEVKRLIGEEYIQGSCNFVDFAGSQPYDQHSDKQTQMQTIFINRTIGAVIGQIDQKNQGLQGNFKSNVLVKELGKLLLKTSIKVFLITGSNDPKRQSSTTHAFKQAKRLMS